MFRTVGHMAAACPRAQWFLERLAGAVSADARPNRALRVLDLGFAGDNEHLLHDLIVARVAAAPGMAAASASRPSAVVIGLDRDIAAVRAARLERTLTGDATRLPFPDGCFDIVIAGELLEHVAPCDPILLEAHRALKPGGRLLLSTPNGFDALKIVRWWLTPARPADRASYRGFLGHPTHRAVLCPPSLLGRLDDAGFDIVDCQTRRMKVPLLWRLSHEPLIFTWRVYPFTRLGEFLCVEARRR